MTERKIYSIFGVQPEIQAYAMAKYSRSSQSMLESIGELSSARAEEFLNTFYFQYGHRSIADLAHVVIALEQISILAAVRVVDQPIWDGQERSTRYQDFKRTGYYVPPEIDGTADGELYRETADALFTAYATLARDLTALLLELHPPAEADRRRVGRTLRARAFDVARYLLPTATNTSVGQVVSSRTLERQICQLLSDPLPEARAIGEDLRSACRAPANAPVSDQALALLDRLEALNGTAEHAEAVAALRSLLTPAPVVPTLVKYTAPSTYVIETYKELAAIAAGLELGEPDRRKVVDLVANEVSLLDEVVATLLYRVDPGGHSYRQIEDAVLSLSPGEKQEIFETSIRQRGQYDELLREHQSGYRLKFDILMDFGSFRDLHRHRRCVQIQQAPSIDHGYDPAALIFERGLGAKAAARAAELGLDRTYVETLAMAEAAVRQLEPRLGVGAYYLMPLAFRNRTLFKMDAASAAYIIELRTDPAGHFSYRWVAFEMFRELERTAPELAAGIRVTDPGAVFDLLKR